MIEVFEFKTGRFTPLDDETLATLSEPQEKAYGELRSAVEAQASADAEVENARAHNAACVEARQVAQENAPPSRTFFQEWAAAKRI
jgi:hypothetical protein